MDFIEEISDLGAPEIAVTGVASIERISAGQVRETYYSKRKDGPIAVVHIVWDLQAWLRHSLLNEQSKDIIRRMLPPYEPQRERGHERH
jgi:hypothetical protein